LILGSIPDSRNTLLFHHAGGHRHGFGKLGRVIALTRPDAFILAQDWATSFQALHRISGLRRHLLTPVSVLAALQ
jgi:hypothetical protein